MKRRSLETLLSAEQELEANILKQNEAQITLYWEAVQKAEMSRKQQETELEIMKEDAERQHTSEDARLKIEEDRIAMEKKHIERGVCDYLTFHLSYYFDLRRIAQKRKHFGRKQIILNHLLQLNVVTLAPSRC